jgi:hypothetical protein
MSVNSAFLLQHRNKLFCIILGQFAIIRQYLHHFLNIILPSQELSQRLAHTPKPVSAVYRACSFRRKFAHQLVHLLPRLLVSFLVYVFVTHGGGDADMLHRGNAGLLNDSFVCCPPTIHVRLVLKAGDDQRNRHRFLAQEIVDQLVVLLCGV